MLKQSPLINLPQKQKLNKRTES